MQLPGPVCDIFLPIALKTKDWKVLPLPSIGRIAGSPVSESMKASSLLQMSIRLFSGFELTGTKLGSWLSFKRVLTTRVSKPVIKASALLVGFDPLF